MEPETFDIVHHGGSALVPQEPVAFGNDLLQCLLIHELVAEAEFIGQNVVENDATNTGLHSLCPINLLPDLDPSSDVDDAQLMGELGLIEVAEDHPLALRPGLDHRQVVAAKNDVQCWCHHRFAGAWQHHIVDAEHHLICLFHRCS